MSPALSRRVALSLPALLAAPTLAVEGLSHGGENPDAELLSLCGRYLSLERRQNRLFAAQLAANEAGDKALDDHLFAVQQRFVPYGKELAAAIFDRTALTLDGLRAKATVAATHVTTWADGSPCCDDMPLWSLCRDLMAKGASA